MHHDATYPCACRIKRRRRAPKEPPALFSPPAVRIISQLISLWLYLLLDKLHQIWIPLTAFLFPALSKVDNISMMRVSWAAVYLFAADLWENYLGI